ncbi:MAG TPA: CRTAC1 family protein, partial [Pyrinomonadaceae bacterium]|nr:CRTAC1 family protein [Pyrinomonadaceae bacterium]
ALSDGKSHFKTVRAPLRTAGATVAQFVDYENDGLLDLVTLSGDGIRLWRNTIDSWVETTGASITRSFRSPVAGHGLLQERSLVLADLDNDGDTDAVGQIWEKGLLVLRNDGGNRNYSIRIDLDGHVSNRSAVEAKVEMRAGSLYQKLETYSASPAPAPADLLFGLGQRKKPDAVRVIWPAGIVQAETEFQVSQTTANVITMKITELDRKPSSCPYLYAWNGERFEFVTDFMGGGEMGYLEEPRRYNKPDPEEYVRIPRRQLKEKNGLYELRVTNELEEALFVDRLQLIAVAHPEDAAVYPNEGMSNPPKPSKLFVTRNARPPLTATDDHGHDVLNLITRIDRRWPDNFKLDRIRGYAGKHSLFLKLSEPAARRGLAEIRKKTASERPAERLVLLLTGWTDYAWSSDNVAAAQAGKAMMPPALQVKDRDGNWRTVIADIGIPVGRPQTVTVDLTGRFLSRDREVRIVTNMRIYWDQILVATSDEESAVQISRLDPVRADLQWRGFSAETTPDGHEPQGYDYARVSFDSPWKAMTGKYTRDGDVRELLTKSDDMFVISRPGDEISLSFDAINLPPLPLGWTRTFLLYSDGFSKEMDINSASPDQLAPLPFHAMSRYPYFWPEHYPLTAERRRYIETYNTRVVTSAVSSIGSLLIRQ